MGKRIKTLPKRNEPSRFNVGLQRKKKDNPVKPKISSNRMTILPGFLSYGVKSDTARKEGEEKTRHENILKGDLHSLFYNKSSEVSSVRRSSRISQKNSISYSELSVRKARSTRNNFANSLPSVSKENSQKKSKSLFKKIVSSQAFANSSSFFKSLFSSTTEHLTKDFNENLRSRIQINLKANIVDDIRRRIFMEMDRVNDILTGKVESMSIMGNYKKLSYENSDNEQQVPEFLFPREEWQYNTPPSQKLNMTLYEETAIQPAIFCNDGTGRNIYELKKDIDTNLINYVNPANIEVDNRYMEQIARFDKENRPLKKFSWQEQKKENDRGDFNFHPVFINQYRQEHLASIHARPKKTVKRLRFTDAFSKNELILRDRQLFKPSTSSVQDREMDFTIVNCLTDDSSTESPQGRFKMVRKLNIFKSSEGKRDIFTDLDMSEDE